MNAINFIPYIDVFKMCNGRSFFNLKPHSRSEFVVNCLILFNGHPVQVWCCCCQCDLSDAKKANEREVLDVKDCNDAKDRLRL